MFSSTLLLLSLTTSATALTSLTVQDNPHARCAKIEVGMNYRDALAIMQREPDSTLSGHSAAGPGGDPPAGSYAIDFWHSTDAHGVRRTSALRYSGGVIESIECGRIDTSTGAVAPAREG
jgi:hypothetical protein